MTKAEKNFFLAFFFFFLRYPPTNFWGVVLFLFPTLFCSLSITGGRSNVAMVLASAMGLCSVGPSPGQFEKVEGVREGKNAFGGVLTLESKIGQIEQIAFLKMLKLN